MQPLGGDSNNGIMIVWRRNVGMRKNVVRNFWVRRVTAQKNDDSITLSSRLSDKWQGISVWQSVVCDGITSYQYCETNVMQVLFIFLIFNSPYMYRTLPAHPQSLYWYTAMHGQSLYWYTAMHGQMQITSVFTVSCARVKIYIGQKGINH
jgi:hypothetical protein